MKPSFKLRALAMAAATLLAGCTLSRVELPDGQRVAITSDAFKAYAEQVFRRQNQMLDTLIDLQLANDTDDVGLYSQLEIDIVETCSALNQYATLKRDGRPVALSLKRRLPDAITACDKRIDGTEMALTGGS